MNNMTTPTPDAAVAEKWKVIPPFPDYKVSSYGRVLSIKKSKVLSTRVGGTGYIVVNFHVDGRSTMQLVHRLLAYAFLGDPPTPKHHAAHKDGTKTNNVPSNIKWATAKENINDKWAHGTMLLGEQTNSVKLTADLVREIRHLYSRGILSTELAKRFNVHKTTICRILKGKTWKHV